MVPNKERGEVAVTLGGVDLILCAEMTRLATLTTAMGVKTFAEVYEGLIGFHPPTVLLAISAFTIDGDAEKACELIKPKDMGEFQRAMLELLSVGIDDEGAKEKKATAAKA